MLVQENKSHYLHCLFITLKRTAHKSCSQARIGQGRAGLKRKVKTNHPMPLPQQTPAQPVVTHVPKTALPLPESVTQSCVTSAYTHTINTTTSTGGSNSHDTENRP